jgi:hypothetical protein
MVNIYQGASIFPSSLSQFVFDGTSTINMDSNASGLVDVTASRVILIP